MSVKKLVASYEAAVRTARKHGAPRRARCTGNAGASTQVEDRPHARVVVYAPMLPEIALALGAMAILMFGVFKQESAPGADYASGWLAVIVLVVAAGLVVYRGDAREVLFEGAFIVDAFSRFMKLLVLAGAALVLVMSFDSLARAKLLTSEYPRADAARRHRHAADDLGRRPHRAVTSASSCRAWRSTSSPPSTATRCARARPA